MSPELQAVLLSEGRCSHESVSLATLRRIEDGVFGAFMTIRMTTCHGKLLHLRQCSPRTDSGVWEVGGGGSRALTMSRSSRFQATLDESCVHSGHHASPRLYCMRRSPDVAHKVAPLRISPM